MKLDDGRTKFLLVYVHGSTPIAARVAAAPFRRSDKEGQQIVLKSVSAELAPATALSTSPRLACSECIFVGRVFSFDASQ